MISAPRGLAAALVAAGIALAPAAHAIEADWPTAAQTKPSNPDLWRSIKKGAQGAPGGSTAAPTLMKALPACNDLAVGFSTPVNTNVPLIGTPQGQGPTMGAMVVLALVFGAACGAGAMLARNLGKHGSEA